MAFWDPEELNLVNNKPQDKKLHAHEARSAFGSTDFHSQSAASTPGSISSTNASPQLGPGNNNNNSSTVGFSGSLITPTNTQLHQQVSPHVGSAPIAAKSVAGSAATAKDKPATAVNLCNASMEDRSQALQSHQESVPLLPVPELEETLDLYMKSLEGLVSAESWQRSRDNVDAFLQKPSNNNSNKHNALVSSPNSTSTNVPQETSSSGESVAEQLQKMLKEHAASSKPNWLETFWDDMYLYGRDPIPINVNYFFALAPPQLGHHHHHHANQQPQQQEETIAKPTTTTLAPETKQLNRAASLIHSMASIYNEIRLGKWSLDHERKSPQCMSQYRRVFCASRIPGEERDSVETYLGPNALPLSSDEVESTTCNYITLPAPVKHIVVIIRNRFFSIDVLAEETTEEEGTGTATKKDPTTNDEVPLRVLSVEEIAKRLAHALVTANTPGAAAGAPVGVLTTMSRTDWWRAREQLKVLGNEQILAKIQSAIWLVALDGLETSDSQERARIFLHGPGTNRWFDRHTLIITRSGDAGINFEHAIGDGATTLRIADEMYRREKHLHAKFQDLTPQQAQDILLAAASTSSTSSSSHHHHQTSSKIHELHWKLDGQIDFFMRGAYTQYVELIQSTETTTLDFNRFGGDYIKKSGNSPDAFVQLAFQLTHHRLFGRPTATYEAASTRTFSHGRTEVLRSCTRAATDFCQMSGDPIFSHRVNSSIPPQLTLLRNATEAHVQYMRRAKEGRGVDRHLLGLRLMAAKAKIPLPDIFTDENFKLSSHWALSTSHCGSSALTLFGFGPVVPDGFGLGYMIKNDCISLTITSKYTHRYHSSKVFSTMLESSLLQMQAIVDADWESRAKARPKAMEFSHPTTFNDIEFEPTRGFIYSQKPKRSLYDDFTSSSNSGFSPSNSFANQPTY